MRYRTDIRNFHRHAAYWLAVVWFIGPVAKANMFIWIVLGYLVGWTLGLLFVRTLMRMADDEDRAARREEMLMNPFSNVPITAFGRGH